MAQNDFMGAGTANSIQAMRREAKDRAAADERAELKKIAGTARRLAGLLNNAGALPKLGIHREGFSNAAIGGEMPPTYKGWMVSYKQEGSRDRRLIGSLTLLSAAGSLVVCRARFDDTETVKQLSGLRSPRDATEPIVVATVGAADRVYTSTQLTYDRLMDAQPVSENPSLEVLDNLGRLARAHELSL